MLSTVKRQSPALVVSLIALIVALSGTATAASGLISSKQLKKNAVTSKKIKNGEVKGKDLGLNVVDTTKVQDGSLATGDLADLSVTTNKLADLAVTTGKLANNAVTTAKIADNAVTTGKIANDAVNADKIAANAVSQSEIATNGVGSDEIAPNSVGGNELKGIVFRNSGDVVVPNGESRSGTANCAAGERMISGGLHWNGAGNTDVKIAMLHSYPLSSSSWFARGANQSGADQTFQTYVACLAG